MSLINKPIIRLGEIIRAARNHAELTQRELAEILCISTHHLMMIEKGQEKPSFDLLCDFVEKLNIEIHNVFDPGLCRRQEEIVKIIEFVKSCTSSEIFALSTVLHVLTEQKTGNSGFLLPGCVKRSICSDCL